MSNKIRVLLAKVGLDGHDRGVKIVDMILVGGGVMPDEDVVELKKMGVHEVLLQDTPPNQIIASITRLVAERGPK